GECVGQPISRLPRPSEAGHYKDEWTARPGVWRKMVDVTGIEPVTPCLQSRTLASNSSFRFL
ncbi:MAG: hypothetical protein WA690_09095, partial [Candidatus Acidiferrales bacterium]